ncbi:5-oxoprolinase subunit PxpB [Gracilibacillus marinus]|jgi:inhibitor of KinA|uniref:5-oxoprolinase subunit PxpB n=1 Tax=Gracilibacillus marinus TaxID=630535 RepID=A0ABV8VXA4_9BACI
MSIRLIAENAIMIHFNEEISVALLEKILIVKKVIEKNLQSSITEIVIGYNSLVIYFDPITTHPYNLLEKLKKMRYPDELLLFSPSTHHIPVCYEESFNKDLSFVATYHNITMEEVVHLHTSNQYTVHFLGFSPGFPFLGGIDDRIATPRKGIPDISVPEGSVGIAGSQTGIYPSMSPGGWQIIGRTPIPLVNVDEEKPTLFQPGDNVHFYPITSKEFEDIRKRLITYEDN